MEEQAITLEEDRALEAVWGRKVARLPDRGVLLISTDLQGHRRDYEAMKAVYAAEEAAGNQPVLAFCGDMVHGPGAEIIESGRWPSHLGPAYIDQSDEILRDFESWTRKARAFSLLGNHEHAHVGGPRVSRFHLDEAAALNAALGRDARRMREFMSSFPLLATGRCGVVLCHGAPAATEATAAAFETIRYDGFSHLSLFRMHGQGTLGALLWARCANEKQSSALLSTLRPDDKPAGFVVFGHDIVPEGIEKESATQLRLSTSFGVEDRNKAYLRLDLSRRYRSTDDLRDGQEIRWLYR